jgi:hypothetical protein
MNSNPSWPKEAVPPDDQITPDDAPTIKDPNSSGRNLLAHNASLLVDLAKKETGHTDSRVSLQDITSNQVICLLLRQKHRRCKQIYDERVGKVSIVICLLLLS